jgi:hypothetical protein
MSPVVVEPFRNAPGNLGRSRVGIDGYDELLFILI